MDFDISFGECEDRARQAFRTRVPGLVVKFHDSGQTFDVKDISASGFAVQDPSKGLASGESCEVSFYLNKKLFLGKVFATVVRTLDDGITGLTFDELKRQQALKLDKLVLEVQKRLIKLRKSRAEE
ncbi:PilZ domain-containing protein [Paucidesulfovibrio gracilis DSM 16080]|uniref:PilZ domain-containing protein n=1 Tax=Paucidesulfovibrio gracilis DSM 16080 TaxID=1121449 RepID=A0A1T4WIP5_9BACT|nr:PilZ domain-containing protein [Paucidesulfovibrio gracilis]SKA77213.1 PilZ domain-containing protein [Paucidesulfovibrio gracilis DSM 16080]